MQAINSPLLLWHFSYLQLSTGEHVERLKALISRKILDNSVHRGNLVLSLMKPKLFQLIPGLLHISSRKQSMFLFRESRCFQLALQIHKLPCFLSCKKFTLGLITSSALNSKRSIKGQRTKVKTISIQLALHSCNKNSGTSSADAKPFLTPQKHIQSTLINVLFIFSLFVYFTEILPQKFLSLKLVKR